MLIQNINGSCVQEKLVLTWELFTECLALSIQIASDTEFTKNSRTFAIPSVLKDKKRVPVQGITLDTGPNMWFVRIGCWLGNEKRGVINWSGIVGPFLVISKKSIVPARMSPLRITRTQPLVNGIRLFTGYTGECYSIIEYSDDKLLASTTKTIYSFDMRYGYIDCLDLVSDFSPAQFSGIREPSSWVPAAPMGEKTYNIRLSTFADNINLMPVGSVKQMAEGVVVRGVKPSSAIRPHDTSDRTILKADAAILREASHKNVVRFSSQADYTAYLAAKARASHR